MKQRQKNILIVLILILLIIFIYFLRNNLGRNRLENNKEINTEEVAVFDVNKDKFESKVKKNSPIEEKEHTEEEKKVMIVVLDKVYEIRIRESDSLYRAMINLENKNESNFSFNYKEYPSLGVFVHEINGLKAGSGKYWIYSVNGQEAVVGISNYILKDGDIINWELQ